MFTDMIVAEIVETGTNTSSRVEVVVEIIETGAQIPLHEPPLGSSPRPEVFFFSPLQSSLVIIIGHDPDSQLISIHKI